jgi:hypothetical protein
VTNDNPIMSHGETARYLGIGLDTLRKLRSEGRAPPATWKTAHRFGFLLSDVKAWIAAGGAKGSAGAGGLDSGACGLDVGFALSDHGAQA